MSPESKALIEKHWLSALLTIFVLSFFIYIFVGIITPAESDHPSIYDEYWQRDNSGGINN